MRPHTAGSLIIVILLGFILSPAPAGAEDAAGARDRVQAAYERYTAAVKAGKPEAECRAALEAYQSLYREYLGAIGGADAKLMNAEASPAVPPAGASASAAEPSPLRRASEAAPQSRFVEPRRFSPALYAKKSRINDILARLEAALAAGVESPVVEARLRLELAFLYSEFKKDVLRARALVGPVLEQAKTGTLDPALAAEAQETATRLEAKAGLSARLETCLTGKQAAYEARARLASLSFFKNPVAKSLAAWDYLKTRLKYSATVADLRQYRANYEATGNVFLKPTGLSFLFDLQKYDLCVEDVYEAIDVREEAADARARLLTENVPAWHARWKVLTEARRSIDVTYFIVEPDIFGMSLMGILLEKAKQGLRIRFMIDARGTKQLAKSFMGQDYLQELVQFPNVQVRVFNPLHAAIPRVFGDIRKLICSNHDKIILVDGEWVITGGRNVSKNYFPDPRDYETVFRDTDVLVHSALLGSQMEIAFTEEFDGLYNKPVARDLFGNWRSRDPELTQAYRSMDLFLRTGGLDAPRHAWTEEYNLELATYRRLATYASFIPFPDERRHRIKVVDKHSFNDERNDITETVVRMIEAASSEIVIQNPYVILTDLIHEALKRADRRGVKIIIHTNSPVSTDSLLTQAFFIDEWKKFLVEMPNLRIFAFNGRNKLHAKVFVFDRRVTVVGTYNMDAMSEQINSEVAAVLDSEPFALEMRAAIDRDLESSVEYKAKLNPDGSIEEVYGPRDFSPQKSLLLLDTLKRLKILKYLI